MYRAIPEVNRICSMADRARKYKQHQEALSKIKNRPKPRSNSVMDKPMRPYSLHGKAQKEELMRINVENKKMYNAILYRSSIINRADFKEHEMDHQHQVSRMTQHPENYGYVPNENKKKETSSKASELPEIDEITTKSQILKPPVPKTVSKKKPEPKAVKPIKPRRPLPKSQMSQFSSKPPTFETETNEVVVTKQEENVIASNHSSKKSSKHASAVASNKTTPKNSQPASQKHSEKNSPRDNAPITEGVAIE